MLGMNPPMAILATTLLSEDLTFTLGFGVLAAGGLITWAETRFHVSGLRETVKAQEVKIAALETRLAAAEVREGRTLERLDALADRLNRIESKLDTLLERRSAA